MKNQTKKTFKIARLLSDFNIRMQKVVDLGLVLLVPLHPKYDVEIEKALQSSLRSFGETSQLSIAMLVSCEVEAESLQEADYLAEIRFNNTLDVIDAICNCGVSKLSLLNAGYYEEYDSKKIHPRTDKKRFQPYTAFVIKPDPSWNYCKLLLSRSNKGELHERYIKSTHWTRSARWETNPQLRVLFKWFSMEALLTIQKNDNVVPHIMWALGYPMGAGAKSVKQQIIDDLLRLPTYKVWKKRIEQRLNGIREFRISTVHDGFRYHDIDSKILKEYNQLATFACSRAQSMALVGLLHFNLNTTKELIINFPRIFETNNNLVDDVHKNIIFSLEHPD